MDQLNEFKSFKRIPRLTREIRITEKIDGTNAQIFITDNGELYAGSRNQWIVTPQDGIIGKNHGFEEWAFTNRDQLVKELGPGRHYGEWWGYKIQRGYGLRDKRFSLFDDEKYNVISLNLCSIVPVLATGVFDTNLIISVLETLYITGSVAAPGYDNPEGIVVTHVPSGYQFKKTFDDSHKTKP